MSAALTKTFRRVVATEGFPKVASELLRQENEYVPETYTPVDVGRAICMKVAVDLVNLASIEVGLQDAEEFLGE